MATGFSRSGFSNSAFQTSGSGASQAVRALASARAALATFNSTGGRVKRYAIGGREMEFHSIGDCLRLVAYWQAIVNKETAAAAIAAGLRDPRRIYLGYGRA
jgi:thiamine pyrophosphate-dependent acetolactate synthase large subunit-like protein